MPRKQISGFPRKYSKNSASKEKPTAAFAVSGAFALGSHLAFTIAFDQAFLVPVIIGKLISGVLALLLAGVIYQETQKRI